MGVFVHWNADTRSNLRFIAHLKGFRLVTLEGRRLVLEEFWNPIDSDHFELPVAVSGH